jgi:HAE1 family hydrophobic/amphiphilic exporter-1
MSDSSHSGAGLPGLSVRRPWLAAVANFLLVIAGLGALFGLEVRELPNIDRPVVSVRADYPGASPSTVDAEVTSIVESAIARVAGVTSVRSSSEEGNFRIRVEFRPNRDLTDAANDVREAVSRVERRLPSGVEDIFVVKSERDARPIMQIAVWSEVNPIDDLTRIIENEIVPELTAVDGIAEVTLFGERERVIRVAVGPEKLAAYGLSIGEVADTLRAAQFDIPVGSFEAGQLEVLVRADATVTDPGRIEALPIRDRIRLGDIAEVYFGLATPLSFARYNGKLVVNLGIVRQSASNTVKIANDVRAAIDQLEQRFANLDFVVTSDDSVFIEGAIAEVLKSLLLALIIVIAVIYVFIGRLSVTLLPAVTIPVALIASLSGIYLMGFSINLITLLAMVLATGLVVDDAIVVTENIQRRRADGLGPLAAAVKGTQEVFFAVLATTATLVAVFLPPLLPAIRGRAHVHGVWLRPGADSDHFLVCFSDHVPHAGISHAVAGRQTGPWRRSWTADRHAVRHPSETVLVRAPDIHHGLCAHRIHDGGDLRRRRPGIGSGGGSRPGDSPPAGPRWHRVGLHRPTGRCGRIHDGRMGGSGCG